MRYKADHKQATHQKIVETAAREFRAGGFDGVGIARLMGELNLTHGGFYAHFPDKEGLVAEASVQALDESIAAMVAVVQAGGFRAVIDYYLGDEHREALAPGCPLPTLAPELVRHSLPAREAFTRTLTAGLTTLAEFMPGSDPAEKFGKVCALFAALAGAVGLARSVADPALSVTLSAATRQMLLHLVGETNGA